MNVEASAVGTRSRRVPALRAAAAGIAVVCVVAASGVATVGALVVATSTAARASGAPPPPLADRGPEAAPADPRRDAIGLLALPEVYGTEPCQRFHPRPVPVHSSPRGGATIGEIRTTSPWRHADEGGCDGLRVDFVSADGAAAELPAQEYGYEQPAAIVLEANEDWFRVRLPAGDGWVHAAASDEFVPLTALLEREITAFTSGEPITVRVTPNDDAEAAWTGTPRCTIPRVREADAAGGRTWLQVDLVPDECCADDAARAPDATVRGWVPLRRADGVPTVWIVSRGC